MSANGLNIYRTIEKIINSVAPSTVTKEGLGIIVDTILDKVEKTNLSKNEIELICGKLTTLILVAKQQGIIDTVYATDLQKRILTYQNLYTLHPTSTDYIYRFIASFRTLDSFISKEDSKKENAITTFFYQTRSLEMEPTLRLCISIIKAFKTPEAKAMIEHRIGVIDFASAVDRRDANYADFIRLMNIARLMGWYTDDTRESYLLRCNEMAMRDIDENGVLLGLKGNKILDKMIDVSVEDKPITDADLTENFN